MSEIKFRKINSDGLWKDLMLKAENISINSGLRLGSSMTYKRGSDILFDESLDIRDMAVDECDTIYVIEGSKKQLLVYDRNEETLKEVCCSPGVISIELINPVGLAIDRDTMYIADSGDSLCEPKVIALARSNLQIRWMASKDPEGARLTAIAAIATRPRGDIVILESGKKRILRLERSGRICSFNVNIDLSAPTDVAVDIKGNIYILDGQDIVLYRNGGAPERIDTGMELKGISVSRDLQIFAGEPGPSDAGKTIYKIGQDGTANPLWSYRGAVRRLTRDSTDNLYVINEAGSEIAYLEYSKVNDTDAHGVYSGTFISKLVDSYDSENRWHRFLMEGSFVKGSQVEFSYHVSSEPMTDDAILQMNGDKWYGALPGTSSVQGESIRDALFLKEIKGRYLVFKMILSGNEQVSPVVAGLTIFFPRISYLEYLPAIYREDVSGRDFMERFFAIFDSLLFDVEFDIKHISRFFDALGAPEGFLSWLGSWLSIVIDDNWSESEKRYFIKNAVRLYKMRGTREGLQEMLEFMTGSRVFIVESLMRPKSPVTIRAGGSANCANDDALFFPPFDAEVVIKSDTATKTVPLIEVLYGTERFRFCVFLTGASLEDKIIEVLKRLIDEQKPAHTCYGLMVLQPWFYLDMHTYLGLNTCLSKPAFVLGTGSVIGRDSMLHDAEEAGQAGRHARLGIDTKVT